MADFPTFAAFSALPPAALPGESGARPLPCRCRGAASGLPSPLHAEGAFYGYGVHLAKTVLNSIMSLGESEHPPRNHHGHFQTKDQQSRIV